MNSVCRTTAVAAGDSARNGCAGLAGVQKRQESRPPTNTRVLYICSSSLDLLTRRRRGLPSFSFSWVVRYCGPLQVDYKEERSIAPRIRGGSGREVCFMEKYGSFAHSGIAYGTITATRLRRPFVVPRRASWTSLTADPHTQPRDDDLALPQALK